MLEQMTPEIEREKKDAVDAKDFLDMLEKSYADAGGKLRQGRSELERARLECRCVRLDGVGRCAADTTLRKLSDVLEGKER